MGRAQYNELSPAAIIKVCVRYSRHFFQLYLHFANFSQHCYST